VCSGPSAEQIPRIGRELGENSAERKVRFFSAYIAAKAATHKAFQFSARSKNNSGSLTTIRKRRAGFGMTNGSQKQDAGLKAPALHANLRQSDLDCLTVVLSKMTALEQMGAIPKLDGERMPEARWRGRDDEL
jgi:hypothetical protein